MLIDCYQIDSSLTQLGCHLNSSNKENQKKLYTSQNMLTAFSTTVAIPCKSCNGTQFL